MNAVPVPTTTDHVTVRPWFDVVIDQLGHDPRSRYVETYWLSVLGPTTTWLLRRIAAGFDCHPDGFDLDLADTARAIGLGERRGRSSPFSRALTRLVQFDLAQPQEAPVLAVRRKVPPLTRRQVLRLPLPLQQAHQELLEQDVRTPSVEHMRHRARQLALSLLELGEDLESGEQQLLRWQFHPALAREAAAWAWDRHCRARGVAVVEAVARDRTGGVEAGVSDPADFDHEPETHDRPRRGGPPILGILPGGDAA